MTENVGQIRDRMRHLRNEQLNSPDYIKKSGFAAKLLENYIHSMDDIRSVLCFYPLNGEIMLMELYNNLISDYKLYFPVSGEVNLRFYRVFDMSDDSFSAGRMNVPEPVNRDNEYHISQAKSSCAIVPGLAFCPESMGRIGYGKGYYDRFLAENEDLFTIGACFEFQLVDELPQEKWDIPVNSIITEHNIYGK